MFMNETIKLWFILACLH